MWHFLLELLSAIAQSKLARKNDLLRLVSISFGSAS